MKLSKFAFGKLLPKPCFSEDCDDATSNACQQKCLSRIAKQVKHKDRKGHYQATQNE